ncbi:MAG TPA: nucleotide exchange factor GrpE [Bacteroidales bacterium]|nr:nucleotide exchange factor GrpE [Bacteroidales bacterium]
MAKKKSIIQKEKNNNTQHESIENEDSNLDQDGELSSQTEPVTKDASTDSGTKKKNLTDQRPDKYKHDLKQVEAKLADMQDKYIRLSAEFDNYRKRTLREKMEMSKYAGENLLLEIIPLMDDFDRAITHMDTATDCAAIKNGIDLIYGKFSEFLKQNGIKEIESLNAAFDVDHHEAIAKVPVEENDKKGKVVDVILKGYYLQDKVLRFSKVVVGE